MHTAFSSDPFGYPFPQHFFIFSNIFRKISLLTLQLWTQASAGGEISLQEFQEANKCTSSSFYPPEFCLGIPKAGSVVLSTLSLLEQHPASPRAPFLQAHITYWAVSTTASTNAYATCEAQVKVQSRIKTAQIILQQACHGPYLLFEVSSVLFIHEHQI